MTPLPSFRPWLLGVSLLPLFWLTGCGGGSPPIPDNAAVARTAPDAAAIFDACLAAHGGRTVYARLHDVNVRFDSHWASLGPKLQPVLSDRDYRQGSEERYMPVKGGFIVGQTHQGPKGIKHVYRNPPDGVQVAYEETLFPRIIVTCYNHVERSTFMNMQFVADPTAPQPPDIPRTVVRAENHEEIKAAAGIVTDAYAMFLWGPYFFVQRGATFQKLPATAVLDGQPCDELLAILRPGFGVTPEDKVVLFIGQRDRLLHRVQFTLNALESTRGAEVHLDLSAHQRLAGVMWPTRYVERIDRPVNLPAHQWSLLGFDANRGYTSADLDVRGFKRRAVAPAGRTH